MVNRVSASSYFLLDFTVSLSLPPTQNSPKYSNASLVLSIITPPSELSMSSPTTSPAQESPPSASTPPPFVNNFLPPSASNGLPPGAIAGLVVGIGIGGSLVLCMVCVFVIFYRRKKRKKAELESGQHGGPPKGAKDASSTASSKDKVSNWPTPTPPHGVSPVPQPLVKPATPQQIPTSPSFALGHSLSSFSYEELANATNNFSSSNLLGQGGYGYVHKGVLSNGKVVAVKQLKAGSGQGEREFRAEVEIIGHIHHRHLVSLFGYCISGAQRSLVYEFIPNNTMEFHLHGKEGPTLTWPTRLKIALGSARGLAYLHEDCKPKIIHRDIKASNILIDFNFEAKVADFGLAKLAEDTDTHVSTRVMGTFGYLAPEYASSGKLSEKSDVFSFGVVLLELITGRRPIDKAHPFAEDSMVDWARPLLSQALEDNNFEDLADPRLNNEYDSGEMSRMVACAAASIRHSARHRPKMSQIVRALEGNLSLTELNEGLFPYEGVLPAHMKRSSPFGSSDYDTIQYQEDMKNFKKLALETQELTTTSEFSDHGVLPSTSSSDDLRGTQDITPGNECKEQYPEFIK